MKPTNAITIYEHAKEKFSFLPFELPAGKSGKCRVRVETKPPGTELTVVSMRNAIFMGLKPAKLVLAQDTQIHYLDETGKNAAMWMSTIPQEIEQHQRQLAGAHGRVLVGGLGLGVAVGILSRNPKVKSITVVEKSKDILNLVSPFLPRASTPLYVVNDCLFNRLRIYKREYERFDFAFYDIWCPTGQTVLTDFVTPLRRLSEGVVRQSCVECWNEDEMIGQVAISLQNTCAMLAMSSGAFGQHKSYADFLNQPRETWLQLRHTMCEQWPFLNWIRETKPTPEEALLKAAEYTMLLKHPTQFDKQWKQYDVE